MAVRSAYIRMLCAVAVAVVGANVAAAAPAVAEPGRPLACAPDPSYHFSNVSSSSIEMVPRNYGQHGTTVGITITVGTSVTGTIGGSYTTGVSVLVADAKVSVNASIAWTLSASVSYSGSFTVPASQSTGWIAAGAQSNSMNWQYGSYNGACTWIVSRTGTAKLPYHVPYFFHS